MTPSGVNHETILTNARLVLPDEVIDGTLVMRGSVIQEISRGRSGLPGGGGHGPEDRPARSWRGGRADHGEHPSEAARPRL